MTSAIITGIIVAFPVGAFLAIFITPIFCYIRKITYVPLVRARLVKKAKEQGHVVTARLTKAFTVLGDETMKSHKTGTYVYEYRNKTYKYQVNSEISPSQELTLYFVKNPRKACLERELGLTESNWIRYYFMIALALGVVISFVVMNYVQTL